MVSVQRFKRLAAVVVLLIGAALSLAIIRQAGSAIVRSATGADPTSIFTDIPPAPADVRAGLRWLSDPERDGRPMEPRTRDAITDAYARALSAIDRAGRGDESAALAEYLSGPALDAARSALVDDGAPTGVESVASFYVRQDLRLDFYSDDGAVVAIGVPTAEVVRVIDTRDERRSVVDGQESWRFVMLLEDGNWRVQQIESTEVVPLPAFGAPRPLASVPIGANALSAHSGDPTWATYDPEVAAADLDRLAGLGFDAVRVFVASPELGGVDVGAVLDFLDAAAEREVGVIVTLFDGAADHSVDRWADDADYLDEVVGALATHPSVLLWDLKNEPDLDDVRSGGPQVVDAWLDRVAVAVRRLDPDTPLTVGWSSSDHAARVITSVDVVSFHHFGTPAELAAGLAEVQPVLDGRSLIVSEFGRPAWVGFVRGDQSAAQARDVAAMVDVLDDAGLGHLVWQLRDTDVANEPGAVAARASTSYGLFRADGSRRPVADVFVSGTDGVPPPGLVERLRGLLPRIVLVLLLLGVAGAVWRWVWRWEWRWVWRWVRRRVRPRTRPPVGGVDSHDGTDAPGP